ncbi:class I SAM-dependent methyltransferase [Tenggerimyces flavus]|uniref:Class I SAM-dependent methyltransferase n=1 Tax=Tenggerimyces flavus TaxID=1708749 RepID=A0ABV7Y971_9ACTN|nr:methyltransferase domain-containing protein [Tenggerimyces flavus]MBM7785346.1 SAM-dependent methyltransferase [Tenggerimyces flavus]
MTWAEYLESFHARTAGQTEDVLSRCHAGDLTPYSWLIRPVIGRARRVLDLACGSAAAAGLLASESAKTGTFVIGVDNSAAELAVGSERHPVPLLQADVQRLPFADQAFDAVVCSMGLMVVQPLPEILAEVARVTRENGLLVATVASPLPLRRADLMLLGRLTAKLRTTPRFPAGGELGGIGTALTEAGFDVLEDGRERFAFTVRTAEDADLLLGSLYLPDTTEDRRDAAARWLAEQGQSRNGVDVAIPIRRITAMRRA